MALDSVHPLFETTDTFQQLVDHLNYYADNVDSDLRWLDSQIGNVNDLTTENIGDSVTKNLVSAINELDSDLHGAGGGSAATDLLTPSKTIVGAINDIVNVLDPGTGGIEVDSDFFIHVNGSNSFSLRSDSDIRLIAAADGTGGEVYVSADGKVHFQHLEIDRIVWEMEESDGAPINRVKNIGKYDVYSTGDVILRSDTNSFSLNNVIDFELLSGEVYSTVNGDMNQSVKGDYNITIDDPGMSDAAIFKIARSQSPDSNYIEFNLFDDGVISYNRITSEPQLNILSDEEIIIQTGTSVNLMSNDVNLFTQNSVPYGKFTYEGGHLGIYSQDSSVLGPALTFGDGQSATFYGPINLETGSLSPDFDNVGSNELRDILKAMNNRIPTIYDRFGNVLNPLQAP